METMEIKKAIRNLERSTSVAATIEILEGYSGNDELLYNLLLDLPHDYIIESAGRTYMGYLIQTSTRHKIQIDPNGRVTHRELGTSDYLSEDLYRKISTMMEYMYENQDDVDEWLKTKED